MTKWNGIHKKRSFTYEYETGPEIARKLKAQGADIVLCTGGCGTCHRSATIVTKCCEAEGMNL